MSYWSRTGLSPKYYRDRLVVSATIVTVLEKAKLPTFSVYPIYIHLHLLPFQD
nr:hypothetical protein [Nostoc sp. ChiSLP03a]MDZ8210665.1 hypothetical protein [Nostoc sp. ChiSLP03a]